MDDGTANRFINSFRQECGTFKTMVYVFFSGKLHTNQYTWYWLITILFLYCTLSYFMFIIPFMYTLSGRPKFNSEIKKKKYILYFYPYNYRGYSAAEFDICLPLPCLS